MDLKAILSYVESSQDFFLLFWVALFGNHFIAKEKALVSPCVGMM